LLLLALVGVASKHESPQNYFKGIPGIAASAACGVSSSGSCRRCLKSLPYGFGNLLHAS